MMGAWALGHQMSYSYRTAVFRLVDAETGQPVAGGRIGLDYSGMLAPKGDGGTTDAQGRVRLRVARNEGAKVRTEAAGYLPVPNEEVWEAPKPPEEIEIAIYRGPAPQAELVVPDAFRGVLRVDAKQTDSESAAVRLEMTYPGQRVFPFQANPDGVTVLTAMPFLSNRQLTLGVDRARYADGTALPVYVGKVGNWRPAEVERRQLSETEEAVEWDSLPAEPGLGLRLLHGGSGQLVYHVGTMEEAMAAARDVAQQG
jgi:hypothetical protein